MSIRDKIRQDNIYRIDQDICKLHTQQFALGNGHSSGHYAVDPAHIGLEKTVISLEKEKRSEVIHCWSDLLSLRKDFTEALKDYLALKRKMNVLGIPIPKHQNE